MRVSCASLHLPFRLALLKRLPFLYSLTLAAECLQQPVPELGEDTVWVTVRG